MSLPIGIQLKSGVNVHAENLALGVGVCVIFLLYLGLDPTMCSAGWFTCEGVQPRGSFETYQATGMGLRTMMNVFELLPHPSSWVANTRNTFQEENALYSAEYSGSIHRSTSTS